MAFDWETQKERYTGRLTIKTMGQPGQNAPSSPQIESNYANVTYVDVGSLEGTISEAVLPSETSVSKVSGSGGDNAYILPWRVNYACRTRLAQSQTRFVTPNLNGCAVMVAGTQLNPIVIHANCQPDIVDEGVPTMQETESISAYNARMAHFYMNYKLPVWSDIYLALASKMVAKGYLPDANLGILYPKDYLSPSVGFAAVFGARTGGNWGFYVNIAGRTRKFWPA